MMVGRLLSFWEGNFSGANCETSAPFSPLKVLPQSVSIWMWWHPKMVVFYWKDPPLINEHFIISTYKLCSSAGGVRLRDLLTWHLEKLKVGKISYIPFTKPKIEIGGLWTPIFDVQNRHAKCFGSSQISECIPKRSLCVNIRKKSPGFLTSWYFSKNTLSGIFPRISSGIVSDRKPKSNRGEADPLGSFI